MDGIRSNLRVERDGNPSVDLIMSKFKRVWINWIKVSGYPIN